MAGRRHHRRHWFLVADQVAHESWDDNQVATLVRLLAHLHERWARDGLTAEQANFCTLSKANLFRVTHRYRLDSALKSLERLADVVTMSVERSGEDVVIRWPKFADFQQLTGRNGAAVAPPVPVPVPVLKDKDSRPRGNGRLTDGEFVGALTANPAFAHIDITAELSRMDAWLLAHPGRKKTRGFVVNWLNKIERPLVATDPHADWPCTYSCIENHLHEVPNKAALPKDRRTCVGKETIIHGAH